MKNLHVGLVIEEGKVMMGSGLFMILMKASLEIMNEIECRVPIIKENQNGITYKRLIELKGCIRQKMQYQPYVGVKLRMQSPPLEKFCLIVDLNDNSSR